VRLPISLIVGVRQHFEIFTLLDSVDEDVEVIVVLNNSSEAIREAARNYQPDGFRLRWLDLQDSRLGTIKNFGIRAASHDLVLLLDADCELSPGALRLVAERAGRVDIGKVNMIIRHATFGQKVRAANRVPASATSAYTPGLFFHRRILPRIGGYFYLDSLPWREDYELNQRLRRFDVPVSYHPDVLVYHPPYVLWRDLRTAFRCGRGHRIGCRDGAIEPSWKWGGGRTLRQSLCREPRRAWYLLTRYFPADCHTHGVTAALYKLVWKAVFTAGYYLSRTHVA